MMGYLSGIIRRAVCAALLILFIVGSVSVAPVRAVTMRHVTTCDGNAGTVGSLPAQVAAAGTGDTIVFDLNCLPASPITLTASLTPTVDLQIDGTGHTVAVDGGQVNGVGGVTVITINSGRTIGLTALTIQHGLGGIKQNGGTLNVTNCTITGNDAANGTGGGIQANGGTLTITGSVVSGNNAGVGGGVFASGGTLTVTNSMVSGNTARLAGGGISVANIVASIIASTINGNSILTTGTGLGGGIRYAPTAAIGSLTIVNSTIAGNTSASQSSPALGGGLLATGNVTGMVTIIGSTFSGNTSTGLISKIGGGIYNGGGAISITNTVVAGNTATEDADVSGTFASGAYNFIGDGSGASGLVNNTNNDRVGTAASPLPPQLDVLANNGGVTQTMRPLAGSPLLDKIPALGGCNNQGIVADQRGVPRPQNFLCDIGAVEVVSGTFATATTVAATSPTVPAGIPVTLTATVTSVAQALLSGTVSFLDGTTTLGSAPVNASGIATFFATFTTAGSHSLTSLYGGTASGEIQFNPSSSAPQNFSVTASLTNLSPASGNVAGGNTLTLTGTGFLASATASVGGTICTNVQIVSNTTLTCIAPTHAAGAVDVVVTTAGVTRTLSGAYTYDTLTTALTAVNPASGSTTGGNRLTLTGVGFLTDATVTVGTLPCTNVQVASSTTLTCTAPAHAAGAADVAVTTAGVTRTLNGAYSYGSATTLPPPSPSGTSSGNPNALPDQRSIGGTSGSPNTLPLPRP